MAALILFVFVLSLLQSCLGAYKLATAEFSEYASGKVELVNGWVIVNVGLSNIDKFDDIPQNCFANGAYYHIHNNWEHNDTMDRIGSNDCGSMYAGGHFDPWFGCSSSTDANDCAVNNGCIQSSSILNVQSYTCNSSMFESHPYACEVGDMSNKYGILQMNSGNRLKGTFNGLSELYGSDLKSKSIVFHCTDDTKTRALCAPFVVSNGSNEAFEEKYDRQLGDWEAVIRWEDWQNVDSLNLSGIEIIMGEGFYDIKLPKAVSHTCNRWSLFISDSPQNTMWDPTHSCHPNSDSLYCSDGIRCIDTTNEAVNYECDLGENPYNCAVGDISGRIGSLVPPDSGALFYSDRVAAAVPLLVGKRVILQCDDSSDITIYATIKSDSIRKRAVFAVGHASEFSNVTFVAFITIIGAVIGGLCIFLILTWRRRKKVGYGFALGNDSLSDIQLGGTKGRMGIVPIPESENV